MSRSPIFRVDVTSSLAFRSKALLAQLPALGYELLPELSVSDIYFLEGDLEPQDLDAIAQKLVSDAVTDHHSWRRLEDPPDPAPGAPSSIEVTFLPGVTDNTATQLLQAARRLGIPTLDSAATGTRYQFSGGDLTPDDLHRIARELLVNETIQHYALGEIRPQFIHPATEIEPPEQIDLRSLDRSDLEKVSAERRLALNLNEMHAVQSYFNELDRPATDAELETIAQTWSEHCVHKTFKASIRVVGRSKIDSLIRTYLQAATQRINAPWVRSAFVDNAGVIEFDDEYDLSFKVETHNHPSAIEPFGGANTGVGGVVRDVLGVSHRPIAVTDVLCFGPPDTPRDSLPQGVLHPARVRAGVVHGVEDYGNKLGLPTVNGAVLYHPGYTSNPLVYCGCVGIGPRNAHPRAPESGDRIIVIGGRTGRDGLRGATFSSLTMDAQTGQVAGASVQIGDPITEKGVIEVVERARDARLYNAITDCGAGGLSSAVGEMGEHIGARVDLSLVPLKYAGLAPWEIWLSEAQERMVLAVPPENVATLQEICEMYWVELSDIGEFGGGSARKLIVTHGNIPVVTLDMPFLHSCPRLELVADVPETSTGPLVPLAGQLSYPEVEDYPELLRSLLSHPNIASNEAVIRVYDHEVRGMTVVKPFAGPGGDGPSDAAVMKPQETAGWRGFVLANGINPIVGEVNPYAMALLVVDEAVRNAVATGANPQRIAILDNFCWGDPRRPEILGTLVEAARGCYDAAMHYETPFISGKDSLNNEYVGPDGNRHAIPGTLLISSIAIHPDVRKAVTMDLKSPGNLLYLIGPWQPFLQGSHVLSLFPDSPVGRAFPPAAELSPTSPAVYRAYHQAVLAGLVSAAHDLSEGGLAVAAAEMAFAGQLGLELDLSTVHESHFIALFAETAGCFLVEVAPENGDAFEMLFAKLPFRRIGTVGISGSLSVSHGGERVLKVPVTDLRAAFKAGGQEL